MVDSGLAFGRCQEMGHGISFYFAVCCIVDAEKTDERCRVG